MYLKEPVTSIIELATMMVLTKFSREMQYPKDSLALFNACEAVAEELAQKHIDMFIEPFIAKFVNVKDVEIGYICF